MKKSARYQAAMVAVLNSNGFTSEEKLEIIATLMDNKSTAEYWEREEEKKAAEEANA
jgi:hypothetical protein